MDNSKLRRIELLNKAIRKSTAKEDATFRRPSEDVISAYLLGSANSSQQEEMQSAMEKSRAFRLEMIDLVRDLQSLPATEVPKLVSALEPDSVWDKAVQFLSPIWSAPAYRAVAVAAVVVLVAIGVWQVQSTGDTPLQLFTVADNIPASELISLTNRGTETISSDPFYASADSAALAEMRKFITLDSNFEVVTSPDLVGEPKSGERCPVRLIDSAGNRLIEFSVATITDPSAEMWIVGLTPGRQNSLFKVNSVKSTVSVCWPVASCRMGVACIVYKATDGYRALRGRPFKIAER